MTKIAQTPKIIAQMDKTGKNTVVYKKKLTKTSEY